MLSTTYVRIDGQPATHERADEPVPQYAASRGEHQPLVEVVRAALSNTGYLPLRNVVIEAYDGVVVLWGQVPTYYQKQLAQVTVQRVQGVRGIANGLEVVCQRTRSGE